jgi:hypothetical protein
MRTTAPLNNSVATEVVRRNAFYRFAETQKLSLALGRQHASSIAALLISTGLAKVTEFQY